MAEDPRPPAAPSPPPPPTSLTPPLTTPHTTPHATPHTTQPLSMPMCGVITPALVPPTLYILQELFLSIPRHTVPCPCMFSILRVLIRPSF